MGRNAANEQFNIKIANTDNDTRERKALGFWWPDILLLLCIFHTWQSWRNALNKYLVGIPKGEARQTICSRLGRLLMHLLKEICDYDKAIAAYNQELTIFKDLKTKSDELLRKQGKAGLMFLAYLQGHLKLRFMWLSWSPAGAIEAARRLDVPVSKIACTTNHLKSFNHHIKGKYLASYVRSRRLPRIDYWIQIIITEAIPHFFAEWHKKRNLADYQQFMRMEAPREQANTMTKPVHPSKDAIERRLDDESKVSQVQFETEMLEQLAEHSLNDTNDVPDDVPDMQDGYGYLLFLNTAPTKLLFLLRSTTMLVFPTILHWMIAQLLLISAATGHFPFHLHQLNQLLRSSILPFLPFSPLRKHQNHRLLTTPVSILLLSLMMLHEYPMFPN